MRTRTKTSSQPEGVVVASLAVVVDPAAIAGAKHAAPLRSQPPPGPRRKCLRTAFLELGRVLVLPAAVAVAVMMSWTTPAQADVDPTGAFETSVPIKLPSFHGLEPRLGLTYSSSGTTGWVGTGWTLSGLSTIRRQSATGGLPHWDAEDGFALDGRDLLACPATNDGSSLARSPSCAHRLPDLLAFTTQVESYQRIAHKPEPPNIRGRQDTWFVWRTDGVKATYEPGLATTKGTLEWVLTKVEDLSGNTVTYEWGPAQGQQVGVLKTIKYGDVEIRFQTEPRPDPINIATGGALATNSTRLQVIDEFAADNRIRSYALRYATNPLGSRQSLLQSVQQYGSDAVVDSSGIRDGTTLPATTFATEGSGSTAVWKARTPRAIADWATTWPAGPNDSSRFNTSLNGGDQGLVPWPSGRRAGSKVFPDGHQWVPLDYNADGRTDMALVAPKATSVDVYVELAKPGGGHRGLHQDVTWPGYTNPVQDDPSAQPLVGDINGDDNEDLLLTGLGPAVTVFGQDTATSTLGPVSAPQRGLRAQSDFLLGDVTGDGQADIVSIHEPAAPPTVPCPGLVEVWTGAGTGIFTLVPSPHPSAGCWPTAHSPRSTPTAHFQLADVNGDLKADLVGFQEADTSAERDRPLHKAKIFTGIADGTGRFTLTAVDTGQALAETTHEHIDLPCGPGNQQPGRCVTTTTTRLPALWSDTDGDGRSDLTLLAPGGTKLPRGLEPDSSPVVAWTYLSQGDGNYRRSPRGSVPFLNQDLRTVTKTKASGNTDALRYSALLLTADFNSDGATDLARVSEHPGSEPGRFEERTLRALSDRNGNWTAPANSATLWTCNVGCGPLPKRSPDRPITTVGDINGDGHDDILFAHTLGGTTPVAGLAADITPRTPSARQILHGDVNADGRADMLYPTVTATGVQVRVHRQLEDGNYSPLKTTSVPVRRPVAQRGWLVADVNCDRRADLVNLDGDVTALVTAGDHDWELAPSAPLARGGRWSVADINGDQCDDLIRVHASGSNTSSAVYALLGTPQLGRPDGGWLQDQANTPATVPLTALKDTLRWQTIDVDGDGQSDLVHVNATTGGIDTMLRRNGSLRCKGAQACWQHVSTRVPTRTTPPGGENILHPEPRCPSEDPFPGWPFPGGGAAPALSNEILAIGGDEPTWRGTDVNGDGDSDLTRVSTSGDGSLLVETLRSQGDGSFSPRTHRVAPKRAAGGGTAGADGHNWHPVDLDHDGRTDMARLFTGCGVPIVQSLLSDADGRFSLTTWKAGATAVPPATSAIWGIGGGIGNFDGLQQSSSMHLDRGKGAALTITGLTSTGPHEQVASIDNGIGARTTINYQTGTQMTSSGQPPPPECRLPTGGLSSPLVYAITTSDGPTQTSDTTTTAYGCPRYSRTLRRNIAWRDTRSTHLAATNRPASTEHVERDVYPTGIVQPTLAEVRKSDGDLISRTKSAYEPTGGPPHTDLFKHTQISTCQSGQCATSTIELAHDEFGNITSTLERAAGSDRQRRVSTQYRHDHQHWLQSQPRRTETVDPASTDRPLRISLVCYDGDTSPDCTGTPSAPRGLATLTRAWDSSHSRFVITRRAGYDRYGNQTTSSDALNHTTTTDYDEQLHLYPVKTCNALNQCSQRPTPWDRRSDAPTLDINPNQATTTHRFDPLGRQIESLRPTADGLPCPRRSHEQCVVDETTYKADATAGTVRESSATAPGLPAQWTRTFTDGLGRNYREEHPSSADDRNLVVQTQTSYSDGSNRPATVSAPRIVDLAHRDEDPKPGDPTDLTQGRRQPRSDSLVPGGPSLFETFSYDASGRQVRHEHADGTASTLSYFIRDGFLGAVATDETGRTLTRLTDGWGTLIRSEQSSLTPGRTAGTDYRYNSAGELTSISDPAGNIIRNTYDSLGRKSTEVDPDRGRTDYGYDLNGNLRRQTDARMRVMTYSYDQIDRRIAKKDMATGRVSRWVYDEQGHGPSVGRLTSVHDPSALGCPDGTSRSLRYDLRGNPLEEMRCVRGTTQLFGRTFDALDRLETLTYPDGEVLTYTYDAAGHPRSVSGYVRELRYDAQDRLTAAAYDNGTSSTWTYDAKRPWLESQRVTSGGRAVFDETTTHDDSGRVLTDTSQTNSIAETYTYGPQGQLENVRGNSAQTLHYDDLGNITHNTRVGTYTYPARRRCAMPPSRSECAGPHAVTAAGGTRYAYDQIGNMTVARPAGSNSPALHRYETKEGETLESIARTRLGDGTRWQEIWNLNQGRPLNGGEVGARFENPSRVYPGQILLLPEDTPSAGQRAVQRRFTWNSEGLLSRVQDSKAGHVDNLYDADGSRVRQIARGVRTIFYGRLADWTPGTALAKYIYAGNTLIAKHQGIRRVWYSVDRLGSPRATTEESGDVIHRQDFAPFGEITKRDSPEGIGYTGHRAVGHTELIDMLARTYDPRLGRMLSADTILPDPSRAAGLNRYTYAYNSPTNYTDPSGHLPVTAESGVTVDGRNLYGMFGEERLVGNVYQKPTEPPKQSSSSQQVRTAGYQYVPSETPTAESAGTRGGNIPASEQAVLQALGAAPSLQTPQTAASQELDPVTLPSQVDPVALPSQVDPVALPSQVEPVALPTPVEPVALPVAETPGATAFGLVATVGIAAQASLSVLPVSVSVSLVIWAPSSTGGGDIQLSVGGGAAATLVSGGVGAGVAMTREPDVSTFLGAGYDVGLDTGLGSVSQSTSEPSGANFATYTYGPSIPIPAATIRGTYTISLVPKFPIMPPSPKNYEPY